MEQNTVIGRRKGLRCSPGFSGFTFIEIVMVLTLMSILAAIAVPVYQTQVLASKEAVLKYNLAHIRDRLDQYQADRGRYPDSLEALVEMGYFRELPEDPMTTGNTWEEIFEDFDADDPEKEPGVYDVRSISGMVGIHGEPYNEW